MNNYVILSGWDTLELWCDSNGGTGVQDVKRVCFVLDAVQFKCCWNSIPPDSGECE